MQAEELAEYLREMAESLARLPQYRETEEIFSIALRSKICSAGRARLFQALLELGYTDFTMLLFCTTEEAGAILNQIDKIKIH